MALQTPSAIFGEWEFSLESWKQAQTIRRLSVLHRITAKRMRRYLSDRAAAEVERETMAMADQSPPLLTDVCSRPADDPPEPRHVRLTKGGISLLHWDLVEYIWALENLVEDLSSAWPRSLCWFAASGLAKALHLYFWSSPEHTATGTLLTIVTAYHGGFALAYLSSLYLTFRCVLQAQSLKQRVAAECRRVHQDVPATAGSGSVCEEDVEAWCGSVPYGLVNWVADQRSIRDCLFNPPVSWVWIIDFIANPLRALKRGPLPLGQCLTAVWSLGSEADSLEYCSKAPKELRHGVRSPAGHQL